MDTKLALDTLKAMKSTVDSNVSGLTAQSESLAIAIAQLEGTLQTQIVEDRDLQNNLDTATSALADAKQALVDANVAVPDTVLAVVPDAVDPAAP